jgi:hypothetical protein
MNTCDTARPSLNNNVHCKATGFSVSRGTCDHCWENKLEGKHLKRQASPISKSTTDSEMTFDLDDPKYIALKNKYGKLRGLGDVVAAVTSAVGIQPCGGCKKRQESLNKLVPFR